MLLGSYLGMFVVGRLLLGGVFVVFGLRNIANIARLAAVLEGKKLPQARALIQLGVAIQILGGALVAIGIFAPLAAAALIAFLILAVYWFHPFWEFKGADRTPHENAWLINIGLSGAFLMVMASAL